MFTKAIVKRPCKNFINGLTSAGLGQPNYEKAREQHHQYIEALQFCGLNVQVLDADERYPDSVFVEDTALLTPKFAIITNPGEQSRKGEVLAMVDVLSAHYNNIEFITEPATVEAGDIMMVGNHFYIGLSGRTNKEGARQTIALLEKFGYTGSTIKLDKMLHLKTGVSYLEKNNLLVSGEFRMHKAFQKFNNLFIDDAEKYAANSLWINDKVLVPAHNPKTKKLIEEAGYQVLILDMTELKKLDGGLSCLSLRF